MSKGTDLITAERERQITKEGWTPEHDAKHQDGSLALAAACYASPVPLRAEREVRNPQCNCRAVGECFCGTVTQWKDPWPWSEEWDKREQHDRLRRLTIAGALIAAEIDRLLHADKKQP
jgi:hypothetical protein